MRKALWIVAALVLLGSDLALAQDQGQRPEDRGRSGAGPNRPSDRADHAGPNQPAARPPSHRPPVARPPYGRRPAHRFLSGGGWHHSIHGPAFRYPPGFSLSGVDHRGDIAVDIPDTGVLL